MTNFSEAILASVPSSAEFRPYLHYDPDGDAIQFITEADTYSAVRIDTNLTVYVSDERPDTIVGGLLKEFRVRCKEMIEKLPGLSDSAMEDGRVRIDEMLSAHIFLTVEKDARKAHYRKMVSRSVRSIKEPTVEMPCA